MTKRIVTGLLMAGLATFTLLYNTQAILPYFVRDYSISPSQAAMSVSAATAGLALGLVAAVPVSERIGRVQLIRFSLGFSVVLGVACAFVQDWTAFLCLRFVMGFVLAGLPGTAAVYLREEIHPSYSTSATGLYIFGTTVGGLVARIASSGVIELLHLLGLESLLGLDPSHVALLFTGGIGVICLVGCWILLPASQGFVPHRDSPAELARKFGRAFRDPVLLGLYSLGFLGMGAFVGAFNVLGFRLEEAPYYLSVGLVGLMYLAYPVAGMAGARASRLAERTSLRHVIVFGPVLAVLGVALMSLSPLWVIILGVTVMAVGFFMIHSLASAWVAQRAYASVQVPAQAASMYMLFYYLGSSINGNLAPVAWELGGWPAVTVLIGAMMLACLVVSVALRKSRSVKG